MTRWIQEFIWRSNVSTYKCEWIKKWNRDRERTGFTQSQRTSKIIFLTLLPNSIKQIQSTLEVLLILRTIHSLKSQIKKALTYLVSKVLGTSVYLKLKKHCSNGLFQSCPEESEDETDDQSGLLPSISGSTKLVDL